MSRLRFALLAVAVSAAPLAAQIDLAAHRAAADRLIDAALKDSAAHHRLAQLADGFGPRFSGTPGLERAIDWIVSEMKKDGFENVHTEPVMVTHWVRGAESAELITPRRMKLNILGLGRSVGTPAGGITAPVLVVHDFAELRRRAAEAKGKIVLFNFSFDTTIAPFTAYGQAVVYRGKGADSAKAVGAVAALVRSVAPRSLNTPHTGGMSYGDTSRAAKNIPTAAVTVENAEMMQRMQDRGERISVHLAMNAKTLPPAPSRNVVAEIRGSEHPEEVIVMGGHIDSWDVGEGAMDDGGGCVAAWEALRLIKQLGVRPKRTIRVVFWTNEEIGNAGGLGYRDAHKAELANHVYALESDNGVFTPRGLYFSGTDAGIATLRQISPILQRLGATDVQPNGSETDVGPINALGVPALSINTDQSRYFWYHHSEADTPEKIDPVDIAKCAAIMAVLANTIGNLTGIGLR
jgi:carboxypeptidase Q